MSGFRQQRGFGAIAAIVVLVILAAMSAAIVSFGTTQQQTGAQDVLSSKAWQAARAGNDYGLYQALKGSWTTCTAVSQTLNLTADTGFYVTVSCDSRLFNEGESDTGAVQTVRIFEIRAVACTQPSCPAAGAEVAGPFYVERSRVVLATN